VRLQGIPVVGGNATGPVWKLESLGASQPPAAFTSASAPAGAIVVAPTFPLPARSADPGPLSLFGGLVVAEELRQRDVGICPIPIVSGLEGDLFLPAEVVRVDGGSGTVDLVEATMVEVVTAFLRDEAGRILILRRSPKVGSFQGRWAAVSGFLEEPTPVEQAITEIREETGIPRESLKLVAQVERPVYARDGGRVFTVHPFLFQVDRPTVQLDWEHDECRWILPSELGSYPTVPKLDRVWQAVSGSGVPHEPRQNG
jgi:8-oxo-dGTP diphosphatase